MRGSIRNVEALTGNANDILAANAGNVQQMTANMVAVTGQLNGRCSAWTATVP